MYSKNSLVFIILLFSIFSLLFAQKDKATYVPKSKSPVLEQIRNDMEAENAIKDYITQLIRDRQDEESQTKKNNRKYLAKARRFIIERGDSYFAEGSEANAVLMMMDNHGAVPEEVYTGKKKYEKHNHIQMFDEMESYLEFCKETNYWEENVILGTIKNILNQYMGTPPASFQWNGKSYTPLEFKNNVLKINSNDYVEFQSTTSQPFYKQGLFDVPDNWWLDESYYNIPLKEWHALIIKSIKNGYTVNIGGDVSEPGYVGEEDAAFIPDFIIPGKYINQDSREYGIYAGITEDDHGIHMVGHTKKDGYNWFLIKDSGRSSRKGQYHGYYMWREDYVKLKMLTFMVHKDIVEKILGKCQ